jgi:hypothetical protein
MVKSWDRLGGRLMITAPHAISLSPDDLAVFAVGFDHRVYWRRRNGTAWRDSWERVDPRGEKVLAIAAPFAICRAPWRVELFVVNFDHRIYRRSWAEDRWSDWEYLAGEAGGQIITAPHAVSWGPERLDLFVLGNDRGIWHRWWEGDRSSKQWEQLAGDMISPPHAVSSGPGRIDVFAVAADSELKHKAWRNGAWEPDWESLEGIVSSIPDAVVSESGQLDVFALGDDYDFTHHTWDKRWKRRRNIRGAVSPPRAFRCRSGRIHVFHIGQSGEVLHQAGNGNEWSDLWTSLESPAFSPVSIALQDENNLELFVLGEDSAVRHRTLVAD